ncbi:MAG: sigma 54-interacting transcriptional regulator [Bacteroidota bacterium]
MDREAFRERFGILGDSDGMRRVVDRIRQVARTEITVLLEGESGVGKELLAQAVHALSSRRHKSLVVVNCGAIPEGLIESELFGAEKGAYTGATSQRTGFFEEANGGTIFLDEIGEMPPQAQVRLLRVLETGQFSRVGSSQVQTTDARVVAATNKNLAESVRRGDFREDLYYRLSTVVIQIPALRERREDILPLFDHFLHRFTQQYNAQMRRLSDEARELLVRYNWPGNVRELRNVAEQAVVLVPGTRVDADTLRPLLRGVTAERSLTPHRAPEGESEAYERGLLYRALLDLRLEVRELRAMFQRFVRGAGDFPGGFPPEDFGGDFPNPGYTPAYARPALPPAPAIAETIAEPVAEVEFAEAPAAPSGSAPFASEIDVAAFTDTGSTYARFEEVDDDADELGDADDTLAPGLVLDPDSDLPTMEAVEHALIAEALRRFEGNRRRTAEALGISERTLYRKIKEIEEV